MPDPITNATDNNFCDIFSHFEGEIELDIACDAMIHMMYHALFCFKRGNKMSSAENFR